MKDSDNIRVNTGNTAGKTPGAKHDKPSVIYHIIAAAVSAGATVLFPEFGPLSLVLVCAAAMFLVTAESHPAVYVIPVFGIAALWLRMGFASVPVIPVTVLFFTAAAVIAGVILRKFGGFHDALMVYTFVLFALVLAAAAAYTKIKGISATDLYEMYTENLRAVAEAMVSSAGVNISLENAQTLVSRYEDMMSDALAYAPAVAACAIELCGIAALRLCGFFHNISGSTMYSVKRRLAFVSRPFSVVYIASMIVGAMASGSVSYVAGNITLILLLPGAAGGISVLNMKNRAARLQTGRAPYMPMFVMLMIMLFVWPPIPLVILSLTGCIFSFTRGSERMRTY